MKNFLPLILTVLPIPNKDGATQSLISSSDNSKTQEGKFASEKGNHHLINVTSLEDAKLTWQVFPVFW